MSPRREPLRAAPLEPALDEHDQANPAERWLTVPEAAEAAGVSVGTIRRWYSGDDPDVPSELRPGPHGDERVMPAAAVRERATRGGRSAAAFDATLAQLFHSVDDELEQEPAASVATLPPDMLPVPRDAWDRMLEQLGNLHTAGQELAEARERAAKAETEAAFLRERLAELKAKQPQEPERRRWFAR